MKYLAQYRRILAYEFPETRDIEFEAENDMRAVFLAHKEEYDKPYFCRDRQRYLDNKLILISLRQLGPELIIK